jgi:uncharacterized protein YjeT (DUF2065 family)
LDTSILLARLIGPLFLIVGVGIFVNPEHYRRLVAEFGASPLAIYMAGTTALLLGLLIVVFHNVWEWRWPVIITILGWLTLVKGAVRVVLPKLVAERAERYGRNTNIIMTTAIVVLVLGGVLSYFGYAT